MRLKRLGALTSGRGYTSLAISDKPIVIEGGWPVNALRMTGFALGLSVAALLAGTLSSQAEYFYHPGYPFPGFLGPPDRYYPDFRRPYPGRYEREIGRNCDTDQGVFGPIRPRPVDSPCHVRVRHFGWLEGVTVP